MNLEDINPQVLVQVDADAEALTDALVDEKHIARDEHGLLLQGELEADWAVRKYGENEKKAVAVDEMADAMIIRVNRWRDLRKARYVNAMDFFRRALLRWHNAWRQGHPREKSCPLPHGMTGDRKQQPEIVKDDASLVLWMKANGLADLVNVKETPNWAALKKLCNLTGHHPVFMPTGEEIEAVTLSYRPDEFYVKVTNDGLDMLDEEGEL